MFRHSSNYMYFSFLQRKFSRVNDQSACSGGFGSQLSILKYSQQGSCPGLRPGEPSNLYPSSSPSILPSCPLPSARSNVFPSICDVRSPYIVFPFPPPIYHSSFQPPQPDIPSLSLSLLLLFSLFHLSTSLSYPSLSLRLSLLFLSPPISPPIPIYLAPSLCLSLSPFHSCLSSFSSRASRPVVSSNGTIPVLLCSAVL